MSPAEELRTAVLAGRPVRRGSGEAAVQGHGWGEARELPAEVLYEVLARPESGTRPRAAVLVGVRITGPLNFEATELQSPLIAHGCYFDQPVNLIGAKAPEIRLTACYLPGMAGDGLESRGDLDLSASTLEGLGLFSARIGRDLVLSGATLTSASYPLNLGSGTLRPPETRTRPVDGVALAADGLRVDRRMACDAGFAAGGEVRLVGARIGGVLSFDGATLASGLTGNNLHVAQDMACRAGFSAAGKVRLPGARISGGLSFEDATLASGLTGDNLHVEQSMYCEGAFSAGGEVSLVGAHIGAQLSFEGATLASGLTGDHLQVDEGMYCGAGFSAEGEVRLGGARIGRQLSFERARLAQGLRADGLQVDEGVFCREGFSAEGEVRLTGARIGGVLSFDGARLAQGLRANRVQVDEGMFCREGFSAKGEVRLVRARIGGQLSFDRATLSSAQFALDLDDARIDGALRLRFDKRTVGGMNLTGARVGRLFDSEATWPSPLRLGGCVYGGVEAAEDAREQQAGEAGRKRWPLARLPRRVRRGGPPDVQRRLRWIRLAEEGKLEDGTAPDSPGGAGYAPHPYTQLMALYRQEGRDGDARRVAYERELRHQSQLGLTGRAWNGFLRWTVGYGYKPLRALTLLGLLILIGTLVFSSAHNDGDLKALKSEHQPFAASIYTIDRLIPVVSFGLRDAFGPSGAAQWWAFAYTLLGWALTIAVVGSLNAAVRRD